MLTAVVCSGRNRPQDSKGQWEAIPSDLLSYAAATNRNSSWAPVSSQGCEPEFVDDDEVVAKQVLDEFPHAVVGQTAVEGLDQFGGGEVSDAVTGFDCGDPQCDQGVGLSGAGWSDQADVLRGTDPLQAAEVVEGGGRDRGSGDIELREPFGNGEGGLSHPGAGVGLIT